MALSDGEIFLQDGHRQDFRAGRVKFPGARQFRSRDVTCVLTAGSGYLSAKNSLRLARDQNAARPDWNNK